jgi:hypothetical protein
MPFSKPFEWYHSHSHADPILADGTFKYAMIHGAVSSVPKRNDPHVPLT